MNDELVMELIAIESDYSDDLENQHGFITDEGWRKIIALITEAGAQAIENKLNYYNDVEPNYRIDKVAYLGAKEEALEAIRKLGKVE